MNDLPQAIYEPAQPLIEIIGLHVRLGGQAVLRDIDLSIPRGQTVAIIGESGCGKTVLLKSIVSLIKPAQGKILFDGQDLQVLDQIKLAQQRTRFGFVFQNAALFDSMTVGQNIAFPLRQHTDFTEHEVERIVLDRLVEVGLPDDVVAQKPVELSGGMRKRVGLARALAMTPELMLYDEPTTGLDPIVSDVINELILRSRRRHSVTSIVVTHDMRTAFKVADRIVMIFPLSRLQPEQPQIIFDGTPDEVQDHHDRRVRQFVNGEAGERLTELTANHT